MICFFPLPFFVFSALFPQRPSLRSSIDFLFFFSTLPSFFLSFFPPHPTYLPTYLRGRALMGWEDTHRNKVLISSRQDLPGKLSPLNRFDSRNSRHQGANQEFPHSRCGERRRERRRREERGYDLLCVLLFFSSSLLFLFLFCFVSFCPVLLFVNTASALYSPLLSS